MSGMQQSWWALLLAVCCCVVVVVAQVELDSDYSDPKVELLNYNDPVQYRDCGHLHRTGYNVSGPYVLYMNKTTPFLIRCEFTKDKAFNVIQRRTSNKVSFAQPLSVYIKGFGDVKSDYWAGLNSINYLTTTRGNHVLTISLDDWAHNSRYATYEYFQVMPYDQGYRMFIGDYRSGKSTLIDDMSYQSGMTFQTYDYPDSFNCAVNMKAGWWYNYCSYALLNGHYYTSGYYYPTSGFYDGIYWKDWGGYGYSYYTVSMSVSAK